MDMQKMARQAQEQAVYMKKLPLKEASIFKKIAAFLYTLIGRKGMGKLFYVNSKCGACRRCVQVCPNNAVKTWFGSPFWTFKCKGCFACAAACPKRAVETSALKFVLTVVLIFLPYDSWLESALKIKFNALFGWFFGFLITFFIWGVGYAIALFIMDRVLTMIFSFGFVKKFLNIPFFKKIRDEINPLTIFPVVLTREGAEKLKEAGVGFGERIN